MANTSMLKEYKLCLNCGYKNDVGKEECVICGGKKFILKRDEEKKDFPKYFLVLIFVFIGIIFYVYNIQQSKVEQTSSFRFFVSEEKPFMNYHTYVLSLDSMKKIKNPDDNDINAVLNALRYKDETIRKKTCELLVLWKKTETDYFQKCKKN